MQKKEEVIEKKLEKMTIQDDYEADFSNVVTLNPDNFFTVIKDLEKDVFVMFYSSKSEEIFKPFLTIAETYKSVEGVILATFDRNSFLIPGLNAE